MYAQPYLVKYLWRRRITAVSYTHLAEKNGRVINVSPELPKSFIVCEDHKKITVYISQISPATLKKRTGFMAGLANL